MGHDELELLLHSSVAPEGSNQNEVHCLACCCVR
jgi:hypothetical protein